MQTRRQGGHGSVSTKTKPWNLAAGEIQSLFLQLIQIDKVNKEMNQQELTEELEKHCKLKGNSSRDWLGMIMELLNQFCYIGT